MNDATSHWPGQGNVIETGMFSLNAMVKAEFELQKYISLDFKTRD